MTTQPAGSDFAEPAANQNTALSQSNLVNQNDGLEETGDSSVLADGSTEMGRTHSTMSQSHTLTPSRGGTLKKKASLSKKGSLRKAGSRRTSRPGSVKSLTFADDGAGGNSNNDAFFTPVPTTGSPTDILANRFQAWRKVLKDLITYFRDLQKSYEARSKSLYSLSNLMSNIVPPLGFVKQGGIGDSLDILRDYHKKAISEGNKAKSIEEDVIVQLNGLRSDLGQKIKEIKALSGDFKNGVDKETETTRRHVRDFQEALQNRQPDAKNDPFLVKLGVERQLERQIDEENYLHRAFLNLESSGRELESIVMGEIQKAHSAYAGILKREADEAYEAVENLQTGPLALPKDYEWSAFVEGNEHFVDPHVPVRKYENITYPGKDDPGAAEVKAGLLERKSKYLKSYTAGWYVLSPTHLHEFKSPDRLASQQPIMSLPLAEQKLGSHSNADSTSHKFMLKGRQSGGLHKSHAWVFRAESYDTMMAWFSDIKNLTEKTGIERDAFIRRTHARSLSGGSNPHRRSGSISEASAMEEDEADQVPYSATASQAEMQQPTEEQQLPQRPKPGGRFPSHLNVHTRDSPAAFAPSSPSENSGDHDIVAAAADLPGSGIGDTATGGANTDQIQPAEPNVPYLGSLPQSPVSGFERHESKYGEWMTPAALGKIGLKATGPEEDAPMLQSESFDAAAGTSTMPLEMSDPTIKAQPAPQSSAFVPSPVAASSGAAGVGTALTADSLATTPDEHADHAGDPIKELADRPPLVTKQSAASSHIKIPGSFST